VLERVRRRPEKSAAVQIRNVHCRGLHYRGLSPSSKGGGRHEVVVREEAENIDSG
jgi:hypothetical protein